MKIVVTCMGLKTLLVLVPLSFVAAPAFAADMAYQGFEGFKNDHNKALTAVTVQFDTTGADGLGGGGYNKSAGTWASRFKWGVSNATGAAKSLNGTSIFTFCAEIAEYAVSGTGVTDTWDLTEMPEDDDGWLNGSHMTSATADLMSQLYAGFFRNASQQSVALYSMSDSQLAEAAAFQIATWEIMYESDDNGTDVDPLNVNSGDFKASGIAASILTRANAMLGMLGNFNANSNVIGFWMDDWQDQMYYVPVPAPVALAGVGLLGVIFGRKRLRSLVG